MPILSVKNLIVKYGTSSIVDDVSFDVEAGDFVGIAGPNGAGKTTLIKAILGLVPFERGEVSLFGGVCGSLAACGRIGYLPQKTFSANPLFPATVEEVVLTGLLPKKRFPKRIGIMDREAVRAILEELDAETLAKRSFSELSGGQHQRVLLARSLVSNPDLLVFDEPSTALDPRSRDDFFALLGRRNREKRTTVLFITHDTTYIERYANRILYLDRELVFAGGTREFFERGEFRDTERRYHIHYFDRDQ